MGQGERQGRTKHRLGTGCSHQETTSTVTAGIRRVVCNSCGRVSISFQAETVRIRPTAPVPGTSDILDVVDADPEVVIDLTTSKVEPGPPRIDESKPSVSHGLRCSFCERKATFYTPEGLACGEHAWQAASDQIVDDDYFWIPLLLDR